jgi:hypothetical protein
MRDRLYIPREVREAIRDHIASAVKQAIAGYLSASEDEDCLTGHLGAKLQIDNQKVTVLQDEIAGEWTWAIDYRKFRGRGQGATEKLIGADGLFELAVALPHRTEVKSLLFQAKMAGNGGRPLVEQCLKMSTWREAAIVVEYSKLAFSALHLDDVIEGQGRILDNRKMPLADLLGRAFLECKIGNTKLKYHPSTRLLAWTTMTDETVAVDFRIGHRVGVRVRAPGAPGIDKMIRPDQIHDFRMKADDDEILGVDRESSPQQLKAARRRLALTYHPDAFSKYDSLFQKIATRRVQEGNNAHDHIRVRRRGSK